MTCDVLLKKSESGFVATVMGLPNCIVEAATRDGALEAARRCIARQMAEVEVVKMEVDVPSQHARFGAGAFADEDPESWNEFLTTIKANRLELDVESELSPIGPGMWKDNPLFDEFVAAMKTARDEIDANPNRL